jgi:hypothetical protein
MFVILSQQRSGTHFLLSLLGSHPRVKGFGELLEPRSSVGFYPYRNARAEQDASLLGPDKAFAVWRDYLAQLTAGLHASTCPVAIVMYNQLGTLPRPLAEHVFRFPVVHLIRRNLLRTHLSDHINRTTDKPPHTRKESPLSRVSLPVDGLVDELRNRAAVIETHRRLLRDKRHIEVSYEALCADPETRRITDFLGIEPLPLSTTLRRSNPHALREILANYDAVEEALRDTEFAPMLTGDA